MVYGGFAGTEATFDPATNDTRARNAEGALTNVTILSGDLLGNDGTRPVQSAFEDYDAYNAASQAYETTRNDNSNRVVMLTGANVTLDGLTITAGHPRTYNGGGGLYAGSGTSGATLTDCTFTNNRANNTSGGAYFGETATLTGCTFTNNTVSGSGGGAYFGETATLTGCTFTNNMASGGGSGGGADFDGTATLTGCTFTNNTVGSSGSGGGADFDGTATLTGCTFTGNEGGYGGGANFRGVATLTGCTFTGNEGDYSGGLSFNSGGKVINSTFYNNSVYSEEGGIGVSFNDADYDMAGVQTFPFILQNSILVGNTTGNGGSGQQVNVDNGDATNVVTLQNNLIAGGADPRRTNQGIRYRIPGSGNITQTGTVDESDASVVFASTDAMDANYLRLKAGSPAVNAGNNLYLNNGTPDNPDDDIKTDAAGEMRIQRGTVDLGAYESDINGTQIITFTSPTAGVVGTDIELTATGGNSGLPVTFAIAAQTPTSGAGNVATLTDNTLTLTGLGTVTITATQAGNAYYTMATTTQTITSRPAGATIFRVTIAGAGARDGSSWANAMPLQAALAASNSLDQVWIAGGIYKPHATDRRVSFTIQGGVMVYGGFSGNEATFDPTTNDTRPRNAEGVLTNVTILLGDLLGDDGTRPVRPARGESYETYRVVRAVYDATRDDNSHTVVTITGSNAILDGLTITAGQGGTEVGDFNSGYTNYGAGLYAGAGTAGTTLTGCAFNNNGVGRSRSGGGARFDGTVTLTNCTFTGNEGSGASFGGTATLTNCVVVGNEGYQGGGLWFSSGGTVINSTLYNNNAGAAVGGGIRVSFNDTDSDMAGVQTFPFILQNSILVGNTTGDGGSGQQVYLDGYVYNGDAANVVTIQNNLIAGGADPMGTNQGIRYRNLGSGNITETGTIDQSDASVVFASTDAMNDNYLRLKTGSPAVNAGNNAYIPTGIMTDAAGNARIPGRDGGFWGL